MNYVNEAQEIVQKLRRHYLNGDGVFVHGINNEGAKAKLTIVDDFGDFAPFVQLYGGEDICKSHLDFIKEYNPSEEFNRAFAYTDLLFGLLWYSKIGLHKGEAIDLANKISDEAISKWYTRTKVYSISSQAIGVLPVTNGIDSTFIELWTEFYRLNTESKYLDLAEKTVDWFENIRLHSHNGLLLKNYVDIPGWIVLIKLGFPAARAQKIMKDNTSYCFSLIDLWRLTKKQKYQDIFYDIHGKFTNKIREGEFTNELKYSGVSLLTSFSYLDLTCDACTEFKDEQLMVEAENLANIWISKQNFKTGLMAMDLGGEESFLDCETDMAVALIKLYYLTNKRVYFDSAIKLVNGVIKYHKTELGFALKCNITTGEITNTYHKTKFVALFIKVLHLINQNVSPYNDEVLFMLTKDR